MIVKRVPCCCPLLKGEKGTSLYSTFSHLVVTTCVQLYKCIQMAWGQSLCTQSQ